MSVAISSMVVVIAKTPHHLREGTRVRVTETVCIAYVILNVLYIYFSLPEKPHNRLYFIFIFFIVRTIGDM